MIIQVAGTSGSGKSFLMRSVLAHVKKAGVCLPKKEDGKIGGYELTKSSWKRPVYVLGPYDVPTGGCDTSRSAIDIFDQLPGLHAQYDILFEGLFVMNMTRAPVLAAELQRDFCVLHLTTPLGECLKSIDKRRLEKGNGKLENQKNTRANYNRATNYTAVMRDTGARVFHVSRDQGLPKILELLGGN